MPRRLRRTVWPICASRTIEPEPRFGPSSNATLRRPRSNFHWPTIHCAQCRRTSRFATATRRPLGVAPTPLVEGRRLVGRARAIRRAPCASRSQTMTSVAESPLRRSYAEDPRARRSESDRMFVSEGPDGRRIVTREGSDGQRYAVSATESDRVLGGLSGARTDPGAAARDGAAVVRAAHGVADGARRDARGGRRRAAHGVGLARAPAAADGGGPPPGARGADAGPHRVRPRPDAGGRARHPRQRPAGAAARPAGGGHGAHPGGHDDAGRARVRKGRGRRSRRSRRGSSSTRGSISAARGSPSSAGSSSPASRRARRPRRSSRATASATTSRSGAPTPTARWRPA